MEYMKKLTVCNIAAKKLGKVRMKGITSKSFGNDFGHDENLKLI